MFDHAKEKHPDAGKKGGPPGGKFSMTMASPVNKDHLTAKANKGSLKICGIDLLKIFGTDMDMRLGL